MTGLADRLEPGERSVGLKASFIFAPAPGGADELGGRQAFQRTLPAMNTSTCRRETVTCRCLQDVKPCGLKICGRKLEELPLASAIRRDSMRH